MQGFYRGSSSRLASSVALALALALAGCAGGDAEEQDATSQPDGGDPDDGEGATGDGDGREGESGDGGEVAIDGCALTAAEVSEIVGSTLEGGDDPSSTINGGVSCAYLHETDMDPSAAVTVGNWDGAEESRDQIVDNNRARFGETTDTPSDVGEHAFLWNGDPDGQTTLIVFDGGRYYTTTVTGIGDAETSRDIVTSLYEAAA